MLHQKYRNITTSPLSIDLGGAPGRYQLKVETEEGVWRRTVVVR